jgi:hypothetical protein
LILLIGAFSISTGVTGRHENWGKTNKRIRNRIKKETLDLFFGSIISKPPAKSLIGILLAASILQIKNLTNQYIDLRGS